jgi:hypothetical protein
MKRGLIGWDKALLPEAVFTERLAALDQHMADFDVPALVVYTDVWRSNDVRFVSNYMPYWNRAFAVVPRGEKPILLCALSPRVYPWIKSVTIHEVIVASPSLPKQLMKLCGERGWSKVGLFDHQGLPEDLHAQLAAEALTIVDMPRKVLRPGTTESEVTMHRAAAVATRSVLVETLAAGALGITDYELTSRLERQFRRAGAEDLVVLISGGTTAPRSASGSIIDKKSSVVVALEKNGHWIKIARNLAGLTCALPPPPGTRVHRETLSTSYSWAGIAEGESLPEGIVSLQVSMPVGGGRVFYGDTCVQRPERLEIL